jgi:hypothetical protein
MTPNTFALESTEVLAIIFYELNKASDEQSITYRSCNSNQLLYFFREGAYGFTTAPLFLEHK